MKLRQVYTPQQLQQHGFVLVVAVVSSADIHWASGGVGSDQFFALAAPPVPRSLLESNLHAKVLRELYSVIWNLVLFGPIANELSLIKMKKN